MAPGKVHSAIADPEAFSAAVDAYIKGCTHNDDGSAKDKPDLATLEALGLATGVYTKELWSRWLTKYEDDKYIDQPQALISQAIKRLKRFSENQLKQECFKSNKAMALALGKCMHGWVEQQHIKHDVKGSVSISVDFGVPPSEHGS